MTARCDLEHGKANILNFLPVVSFADWKDRELCLLLAKRIRSEARSNINNFLIQKGVTARIREIYPLREIIEKETKGKDRTSLLQKADDLEYAETVIALDGAHCSTANDVFKKAGKQCTAIVTDLINQRLPEYYFLESVDILEEMSLGHVILLRRMQTLNDNLASLIAEGISVDDIKSEISEVHGITFENDPICMFTGVLRSPDIEHLGQQFANLFLRIGLEDPSHDTVTRHVTELLK